MIEIHMPRLSDTMTEGVISQWHKKPGEPVEVGDILAEIETDKAIMEYQAYQAGTLTTILVEEGNPTPIGTVIALLDDGIPILDNSPTPPNATTPEPPATVSTPAQQSQRPSPTQRRQRATPLVRKIARQNNIDLAAITGTGPGGRIVRNDISAVIDQQPRPAVAPLSPGDKPDSRAATEDQVRESEAASLSHTRRVIARRLSESARTIPHYYLTATADAEELLCLRRKLNEQLHSTGRDKISINDLLIRACALALREHPSVNASFVDDSADHILVHQRVNIGIAVAAAAGLVVPVITDADHKTITHIASATRELIHLAHDRSLTPAHLSGATFTISNLGMYRIEQFTAIINPPAAAILAVGSMSTEPTVNDGAIVARQRLRYTLSADHRIIDGAHAAQFLTTLTQLIENPWSIIA